jgi:hypothetical protein
MKEGELVLMKLLSLGLSAAEWWKLMSLGPDSTCEISYLAIVLQVEPQETFPCKSLSKLSYILRVGNINNDKYWQNDVSYCNFINADSWNSNITRVCISSAEYNNG